MLQAGHAHTIVSCFMALPACQVLAAATAAEGSSTGNSLSFLASNNSVDPGRPTVIEFVDLENHTAQIKSAVDVNEPLFQSYPQVRE